MGWPLSKKKRGFDSGPGGSRERARISIWVWRHATSWEIPVRIPAGLTQRLDRLWEPTHPFQWVTQFCPGGKADGDEVKNRWSCTSAPPGCLEGMGRDSWAFYRRTGWNLVASRKMTMPVANRISTIRPVSSTYSESSFRRMKYEVKWLDNKYASYILFGTRILNQRTTGIRCTQLKPRV